MSTFTERALRIHRGKYQYNETKFVDNNTPVKIYCTVHKDFFWQLPTRHLVRGGCPMCTLISGSAYN